MHCNQYHMSSCIVAGRAHRKVWLELAENLACRTQCTDHAQVADGPENTRHHRNQESDLEYNHSFKESMWLSTLGKLESSRESPKLPNPPNTIEIVKSE